MRRPRLLDLFCCAGGASMGYHRAGFDVVGVDIQNQPSYPFEFYQADALEFLLTFGHEFDAIHASPPCHDHSTLASVSGDDGTGWLLEATREALADLDVPWVIENVVGSDLPNSITLCGTQFGLRTESSKGEVWLKRHRLFESNVFLMAPGAHSCHGRPIIGVYGTGNGYDRDASASRGGWQGTFAERKAVMGIDWMDRKHLSQALPPAYTEFIGHQLLDHLEHEDRSQRRLARISTDSQEAPK